jgi:hypothetical protein
MSCATVISCPARVGSAEDAVPRKTTFFIDTGQNTIEKQRHSFHAGILAMLTCVIGHPRLAYRFVSGLSIGSHHCGFRDTYFPDNCTLSAKQQPVYFAASKTNSRRFLRTFQNRVLHHAYMYAKEAYALVLAMSCDWLATCDFVH